MTSASETTKPSERASRFGRVMYDRATGAAAEMDCARAICGVLSECYEPGMRVLDVGCGAGHYLRSLRRRLDEGIDYVGVDVNPEYVQLAREAFGETARFEEASIQSLPFEDDAFDLVFASNVLPNLPPPPTRAIGELLRVAKRAVVLRTLFGPLNYVIREYVPDPVSGDHLNEEHALYNNIYSEAFYRSMFAEQDHDLRIEIRADEDWGELADEAGAEAWRTRSVAGKQVAGQLILDWRFIVLRRNSDGQHAPASPRD